MGLLVPGDPAELPGPSSATTSAGSPRSAGPKRYPRAAGIETRNEPNSVFGSATGARPRPRTHVFTGS